MQSKNSTDEIEIPGLNHFMEALAARRAGVFMLTYYHDDRCPTLKTYKTTDCQCSPDADIKEVGEQA